MFGMSSNDFWEEDPQLYWAYRIFYLKKLEFENKQKYEEMKYDSWLKGNLNYVANSLSLNNAFSKTKKDFPEFGKVFENEKIVEKNKKKTQMEIDKQVHDDFNAWARY